MSDATTRAHRAITFIDTEAFDVRSLDIVRPCEDAWTPRIQGASGSAEPYVGARSSVIQRSRSRVYDTTPSGNQSAISDLAVSGASLACTRLRKPTSA